MAKFEGFYVLDDRQKRCLKYPTQHEHVARLRILDFIGYKRKANVKWCLFWKHF